MREFAPLDWILLCSGCRVFLPSHSSRAVNSFLLTLMLGDFLLLIGINGWTVAVRGGFAVLSAASRACQSLAGLVFLLIMNRNRHQLIT